MTRTADCMNGVGVAVSDTFCNATGLAKPVITQSCDTKIACGCTLTPTDSCPARQHCNIVSLSSTGSCVCDRGWTGSNCSVVDVTASVSSVSALACPNGVIDAFGVCCHREIDVVSGACCGVGESVGMDGRCCRGQLDGCGVCNGTGVTLTSSGVCCATALTPSGECCGVSSPMDSCGVCGGLNACAVSVAMTLHYNGEFAALPSEEDITSARNT